MFFTKQERTVPSVSKEKIFSQIGQMLFEKKLGRFREEDLILDNRLYTVEEASRIVEDFVNRKQWERDAHNRTEIRRQLRLQ